MIVLVVGVLGVAVTLVVWLHGKARTRAALARPLHWGALLAGAAAAAAVGPTTWSDSGVFALLLLGVPLVLAAASVGLPQQAPWGLLGLWLFAVLMLGWALLLGLGIGLVFIPSALLLLAAAAAASSTDQGEPSGLGATRA